MRHIRIRKAAEGCRDLVGIAGLEAGLNGYRPADEDQQRSMENQGGLAGRGSLAVGRAGPQGCTALPFDAAHLRALVIGSADNGETAMRAFILRLSDSFRRVVLAGGWCWQEGGAGSVLIGRPGAPALCGSRALTVRRTFNG
jgi:hypothetical protein